MLTTTDKGGVAELAVALAVARLGVFVLRPVLEGRRYDLIFDVGPRLLRVQCKSGVLRAGVIAARLTSCRHTPRGYVRRKYCSTEIDAFAIHCPAVDRCFLVPLEAVPART